MSVRLPPWVQASPGRGSPQKFRGWLRPAASAPGEISATPARAGRCRATGHAVSSASPETNPRKADSGIWQFAPAGASVCPPGLDVPIIRATSAVAAERWSGVSGKPFVSR